MNKINSIEEYHEEYSKSVRDPEGFWAEKADTFLWKKKWNEVLEWDFDAPSVKWFMGAKLNITENCLDRHLKNSGD
jgi:acetyl-CoA synthetase